MTRVPTLPYAVSVAIRHSLTVEDFHPYTAGWWLREPVYHWLNGHVGYGSQEGEWLRDAPWTWKYNVVGGVPMDNAIWFRDPKAAMLFKLTWA